MTDSTWPWRRRLLLADGVFLAFVIGVLLLVVAARDGRRFWHVFMAAVHTLFGAANLVFWDSFVVFGMIAMGIAATVVHFVLVTAHTTAFVVSRESPAAR